MSAPRPRDLDDDVNRAATRELGVDGVLVLRVHPGSAAASAGLRGTGVDRNGDVSLGDVILSIDGREVEDLAELLTILDSYRIGDRVILRAWRLGRE